MIYFNLDVIFMSILCVRVCMIMYDNQCLGLILVIKMISILIISIKERK